MKLFKKKNLVTEFVIGSNKEYSPLPNDDYFAGENNRFNITAMKYIYLLDYYMSWLSEYIGPDYPYDFSKPLIRLKPSYEYYRKGQDFYNRAILNIMNNSQHTIYCGKHGYNPNRDKDGYFSAEYLREMMDIVKQYMGFISFSQDLLIYSDDSVSLKREIKDLDEPMLYIKHGGIYDTSIDLFMTKKYNYYIYFQEIDSIPNITTEVSGDLMSQITGVNFNKNNLQLVNILVNDENDKNIKKYTFIDNPTFQDIYSLISFKKVINDIISDIIHHYNRIMNSIIIELYNKRIHIEWKEVLKNGILVPEEEIKEYIK